MFLFGVQYVAELSDRYLTSETDLFDVTKLPGRGRRGQIEGPLNLVP